MKIKDMMVISLSTAIIAVLGFVPPLTLPFTQVPITLQTLGVMLAGGINKPKNAALSLIVFLLLVASGIPILAGGRGGLSVFVSPSAGYILAWPVVAFCISLTVTKLSRLHFRKIFFIHILFGIFLLYAVGIPVQAFLMHIELKKAAVLSLVYIPGDLLKSAIAAFLVLKLRKVLQTEDYKRADY
ncbi:biotin transporter BioY [Bacillus sp. WMMC1349]|uniref:biotin transporter BioY n=1 Tax=Bacillus sp. WMMC1349 TaxID=2736254 RepID=UPI001557E59C|nr:biotin transporter BioY [Bacillus sp. WMMC1349]NPC92108.1 biotin transporter BioY [Bacillus sp. WMMC1349]